MTRWVVEHLGPDVPLHFTAFHPDFKMLDVPRDAARDACAAPATSRSRTACATPTPATCTTATAAARAAPAAARCVIERDWYELGAYALDRRRALPRLRHAVPGRFDGPPGTWGARRQPVRLADFEARP